MLDEQTPRLKEEQLAIEAHLVSDPKRYPPKFLMIVQNESHNESAVHHAERFHLP